MSDVREIEISFVNTMSMVLDLLVSSGAVPAETLTKSLDELAERMAISSYRHSAGHMTHFRNLVLTRAAQRAAAPPNPPPGASSA
jgi:hypothetical protein